MDELYRGLKIDNKNHIYHVNTDRLRLQKLIKKIDIQTNDILSFYQQNAYNIDIFFKSNVYLDPKNDFNKELVRLKSHYKPTNVMFKTFFPSLSFIKEFEKHKENNNSLFITFTPVYGAFFICRVKKEGKKAVSCDFLDNRNLINFNFQIDFETTEKELEAIDCFRGAESDQKKIFNKMF